MSRGVKEKLKKRYHNFQVLMEVPIDKRHVNNRVVRVKCVCGKIKDVILRNIKSGNTISCGCIGSRHRWKSVFQHGQANKTKLYSVWKGMMSRCNNKNRKCYKHYGGRGISVCENWFDFSNFQSDMQDSFNEHCKQNGDDTSIERNDVNGNYELKNCRWATHKEQMNNTRKKTKKRKF